jgi:hypothetical protein
VISIGLVARTVYRYVCENPGCGWQSQLTGFPERARGQFAQHVEQHHGGDVLNPCTRCTGEGYTGEPGHGAGGQRRQRRQQKRTNA